MPSTWRIRKGDQVAVIAGRDKGKQGRVLSVNPKKGVASVEHVHMMKRHTKPIPQKQIKGGIVEREGTIQLSNLMTVCPACSKPSRIGRKTITAEKGGKGKSARYCKRCGVTLES